MQPTSPPRGAGRRETGRGASTRRLSGEDHDLADDEEWIAAQEF